MTITDDTDTEDTEQGGPPTTTTRMGAKRIQVHIRPRTRERLEVARLALINRGASALPGPVLHALQVAGGGFTPDVLIGAGAEALVHLLEHPAVDPPQLSGALRDAVLTDYEPGTPTWNAVKAWHRDTAVVVSVPPPPPPSARGKKGGAR